MRSIKQISSFVLALTLLLSIPCLAQPPSPIYKRPAFWAAESFKWTMTVYDYHTQKQAELRGAVEGNRWLRNRNGYLSARKYFGVNAATSLALVAIEIKWSKLRWATFIIRIGDGTQHLLAGRRNSKL